MRVLLVHSRYRSAAPSGENNVVDQEAAALVAGGQQVELFQRHSDDISDWPIRRRAMLPARTIWNGASRRDLAAQIELFHPDVVHIHNTFPMLTPSVLYACRDAGVPVVATLHNYKLLCPSGNFFRDGAPCHDCVGGRGLRAIQHGCYRGSRVATIPLVAGDNLHREAWRRLVSAYIFISGAQRDLMREFGLPPDRVFVKHNFVPSGPPVRCDPDHVVAYVGRLDEAKGTPLLMRAWDLYRAAAPRSSLRLVIAGAGPLADEVQAWSVRHTSVDVVGLLPREQAARVVSKALAVVIPSRCEETFGLVAAEAMAAGVAVVASARGSLPELVDEGVTGALFNPDEPEALVRILQQVDQDAELFMRFGRAGRTAFERRFHADVIVDELLKIYGFAVSNPAVTPRRTPAPSDG
jgi:glycosyltransferase involved in cell wall biosynthesis